jgi:large subunit ribosomal protein L24
MATKKPGKQRKRAYEADLNTRRDMLSSHLSKELRAQYNRRSLPVRKGDEVKVVRGNSKGKVGKISAIDYKNYVVFIEGITDKRTVGTAAQIPLRSSNLMIVNPDLNDEQRRKTLLRKVKEIKVPEKVEKKEAAKAVAQENKTEVNHEAEKASGAGVLESGEKGNKVGSRSKAGSAQKA